MSLTIKELGLIHLARTDFRALTSLTFLFHLRPFSNQVDHDYPITDDVSHIANIGKIIENQEGTMRHSLQQVYFGKTRDVISSLRSIESLEKEQNSKNLASELMRFHKSKSEGGMGIAEGK